MKRFAPLVALFLASCDPLEPVGEPVELTLRVELMGGRDMGATPGRVYVFTDSAPVNRAFAVPDMGQPCVLATTPVTTCTMTVPRGAPVTLIAHESDPAVFVKLAPESEQDTVRDGRYVEFTGWSECPDPLERGVCVLRPTNDLTVTASFQLLQQVTFYQTGVASMDYRMFSAGPTLKVPAQNDNILDLVGCTSFPSDGCDPVRRIGGSPQHRFTAFVSRQTIVAMYSEPGAATEIVGWDGPCIASSLYGPGVCSLISPDTSGAPIRVYVHYTWWDCPSGVDDHDSGFCALRGSPENGVRRRFR